MFIEGQGGTLGQAAVNVLGVESSSSGPGGSKAHGMQAGLRVAGGGGRAPGAGGSPDASRAAAPQEHLQGAPPGPRS
jgi:hypothetical protein